MSTEKHKAGHNAMADLEDILEPEAPETRAAMPIRASPPASATAANSLAPLVRSIDAQTRALRRLSMHNSRVLGRARAERVMRQQAALHAAVDERDAAMRRGRPDPLLDAKSQAIARSLYVDGRNQEIAMLRREVQQLRLQAARPHGPVRPQGGPQNSRAAAQEEYRRAVLNYMRTGDEHFRGQSLRALETRAGMNGQIGPDGGYFLQPEYDTGPIERLLAKLSPMRSLARVQTISAGVYKKIVNTGGSVAEWVDEINTRTDTDTPKLAELDYPAMELHAQPKATQVLLDDASIDLEAWLAEESAIAFSEAEGAAFIAGNGVKRTTGLIAYSNVEDSSWKWDSVGYVASGVAGALSDSTHNGADAILQLVGTLRGGYRQAASFLMNRLTMATIAQFKGSDGQYLLRQVYDQASPGAFPTLAGYPVHEDEHMPDIGAGTYPIAFGDFARAYLIVDRVGVSVLRDPFSSYPYVLFRTRKRVGGGIQNFEALKLLKVAAS